MRDLLQLNFNRWYDVGIQLDIPDSVLDEIERDWLQDVHTARRRMFQAWLRTGRASYRALAGALDRSGETALAEQIRNTY